MLSYLLSSFSLNGLAGKIIKGKFPPISSDYSKNLRALVIDMLATNPKKRPDIEQVTGSKLAVAADGMCAWEGGGG